MNASPTCARRTLARLAAQLRCFDLGYAIEDDGFFEQRRDANGDCRPFLTAAGLMLAQDLHEQILQARSDLGCEDLETWNALTVAAAAFAAVNVSGAIPFPDGEVAGAVGALIEQRYRALVAAAETSVA